MNWRAQLLGTCVIWLSLTLTAHAQTDPLHQFNSAVRKLVSLVTPSVVQVLATGYGPVESGYGNSSVLVGMQQKIVLRGSTTLTFSLPVVELPSDLDSLATVVQSNQSRVSQLGVVVIDIDSSVAQKLSALRMASGVLVAARAIDSNADVALEAGDVIHTINGASVKTSEELRSTLNRTSANTPVVLQIERSGKLMFIAFKLDEPGR